MLAAIVRQSVRHPWLVVLGAVLLMIYGIVTVRSAAYDVFPNFVPAQANVQTEAPGFTPAQVESMVTRPLEAVINGANGVETVRSESIQGLSVISITFKEGSDPYRARQVVAEALDDAKAQLPTGVSVPVLTPLVSSTMDLLKIGFVSEKLSPMQLRDLVKWQVRPRLLAVPGVARANIFGGEQRRIEIQVHPAALVARGISIEDLSAAVNGIVNPRGGGFADTPEQRILVVPDAGEIDTQAIEDGVIPSSTSAGAIRIGDVAVVREAAAPKFGDALVMGKPGVLLTLSSQYGANTLDATLAVEAALDEMKPSLAAQGVTLYPALHRPANFIQTALSGIERDLLIGAVLIGGILLLFMRDVRVAAITFLSIPLSLLAALIVLDAFGQTINTMTLGGLAVALGVVIDDAIVDIENIVRRLREAEPNADRRVIIERASVEVRGPVVYATYVLGLTILPILLLTGLQGAFFSPLALAFLLATFASLLVAMTVTPALACLLLGNAQSHDEPDFLTRFKEWHAAKAEQLMTRPREAGFALVGIGLGAAILFMSFGNELLPTFRERHYVLGVIGPVGASFEWMRKTGANISRDLLAIPQVLSVEQQIGRAEAGEDTWDPNASEFHVRLKPDVGARGEDEAQESIRKVLQSYPAIQTEITTFLGDRIGESLSGETAAVTISINGTDLATLDRIAAEIAAQLKQMPDAADVIVHAEPGTPMLRIGFDPRRMAVRGIAVADAEDAIRMVFQGRAAGQINEADRTVDVAITVPPDLKRDPEAIGDILIKGGQGRSARLADIADISLEQGRAMIVHEGGQRRQVVTANPTRTDIASFVADAKARIASNVTMPKGIYLSWGGAAEGAAAANRQLAAHVAVAALAIAVLLVLAFGGMRPALLILAGMPLAMAGGVLAVALTGGVMSLGALVGFVTLFGISARNAILLVSHVDHLVVEEGAPWSLATVLCATRERVTPILMTALVTAFGLAPLALESGQAGREVQGPMATVILGGLISSLALTLLLMPALIWRRRQAQD